MLWVQPTPGTAGYNPALDLIAQQLQLLAKQIELLQGGTVAVATPAPMLAPAAPVTIKSILASGNGVATAGSNEQPKADTADLTPEEKVELKKPFGATARIDRQASELSTKQQNFLQQFTDRYTQKTGKSKAFAQEHRAQMADPRVVSGFRPLTKEIVYPLVVNRSKGSRLWDIDGNEYIDALNGFGSNMFGYQPDWIKEALHEQIELGYEVGPQHELAGEVCKLICELTNTDRAALCNTGSEAVLGTMRIARTVYRPVIDRCFFWFVPTALQMRFWCEVPKSLSRFRRHLALCRVRTEYVDSGLWYRRNPSDHSRTGARVGGCSGRTRSKSSA